MNPEDNLVELKNQDGISYGQIALIFLVTFSLLMVYLQREINKTRKVLIRTADVARRRYESTGRWPFAVNPLTGVGNGMAAPLRRETTDYLNEFKRNIKELSYINAKTYLIQQTRQLSLLTDRGVILGNAYRFVNSFLRQLRFEDLSFYKKIVEEAAQIKFLSDDAHTLYRRDQRNARTILNDGFELVEATNNPAAPRLEATGATNIEGWTRSVGVSTAKVIPPTWYGRDLNHPNRQNYCSHTERYDKPDRYYEIRLPKGHNLLLIDIVASPCNARLSQRRRALQEVNSLDPIPPQYVYARVKEVGFFGRGTKVKVNAVYDSKLIVNPRQLAPRGFY